MPSPALSRFQIGPGEGPEMWAPTQTPNLISLHMAFQWRYHDLCLFHQVIHRETQRRSDQANQLADQIVALGEPTDEFSSLKWSRMSDSLIAHDMETSSIDRFGGQLFVIGLWALAEQACWQTLRVLETTLATTAAPRDYRWRLLIRRLDALGIDARICKSFEGADECRTLNNKLKHDPVVDTDLGRFDHFAHRLGEDLDRIPLDVQFYADSVFEFVGSVLETTDDRLSGV